MIKPCFETELGKIIQGHTLSVLKKTPKNYFDTIITSPPYWGLRDYGDETKIFWDEDENCRHIWANSKKEHDNLRYRGESSIVSNERQRDIHPGSGGSGGQFCSKCGAWYGQLGLEPTLDLYIKHLLQITIELKRVLKPTGVLFWNHGDCYGGSSGDWGKGEQRKGDYGIDTRAPQTGTKKPPPNYGITPKCLALQNYRLIIKMIDEQGWILRNDIKWHKLNHMPSSVKDRFANAYEPVFMLVKNKSYWFDLDAVRKPHKDIQDFERHAPFNYRVREAKKNHKSIIGVKSNKKEMDKYNRKGIRVPGQSSQGIHRKRHSGYFGENGEYLVNPSGKNPGDVWEIATQPFPEAHFATFPEKLIEPMILSSCPQWICKKCGKARMRIIDKGKLVPDEPQYKPRGRVKDDKMIQTGMTPAGKEKPHPNFHYESKTLGWTDCGCNAGWTSGTILDPFGGSGTVGLVADRLQRKYVLIELKKDYIEIEKQRIQAEADQKKMEF